MPKKLSGTALSKHWRGRLKDWRNWWRAGSSRKPTEVY
jgi:hypothetical protein